LINIQPGNFTFNYADVDGKRSIFDILRKKFVALTPEEFVRQHVIHYLIDECRYQKNFMQSEVSLELNGLKKRADLIVFNRDFKPFMLVECKAPSEEINFKVLEQLLRYNQTLNVSYGMLSNGKETYCAAFNQGNIVALDEVPSFPN
jgi:hypothetical protein